MNKIVTGILGLLLVVGVTSGTAYALFSSTATASGVTFATGNADLKIWDGNAWAKDWSPSFTFNNLYPGYNNYQPLHLKNESTSPIGLTIKGILMPGATENPAGAWNTLKDVVKVNIWLSGVGETGYKTLNEWNTTGFDLPGGAIPQNQQKDYRFYVLIDSSADNTIAGQSLSNIVFQFTGTQAP